MDEYIERELAIEALSRGEGCGNVCRRAIERIPSADVAPVRHGRWRESGPLLECQSCGEVYSRLGGNAGKLWNYCPNCGAKMDGGAENATN